MLLEFSKKGVEQVQISESGRASAVLGRKVERGRGVGYCTTGCGAAPKSLPENSGIEDVIYVDSLQGLGDPVVCLYAPAGRHSIQGVAGSRVPLSGYLSHVSRFTSASSKPSSSLSPFRNHSLLHLGVPGTFSNTLTFAGAGFQFPGAESHPLAQ